MKNTILNIFTACGKTYPINDDIALKAINLLSEIIDQNHSLSEPEEFIFKDAPIDESFPVYSDYLSEFNSWQEDYNEALQNYFEENEGDYSELFDAIETLTDKISEDDFNFEYDGSEFESSGFYIFRNN